MKLYNQIGFKIASLSSTGNPMYFINVSHISFQVYNSVLQMISNIEKI